MSLINELIKGLLPEEEKKQTTAVYAGGFKPPTSGHFEVVKQALKANPEIDEFIIFIGNKERNGISQSESLLIWEIYNNYLPFKVKIEPTSIPPIKAVYNFASDHPTREVLWVIGAREGNEEDFKDITSRTKSISKYPNLELRTIVTSGGVSGTAARNAAKVSQEKFVKFLPGMLNPEERTEIYNIVADKITENATYSQHIDIVEKIAELTNHMIESGMNIEPLPTMEFIDGDTENAENFFGKTAYYDPNKQHIVLYTEGRHPKDILRSYAHEMIHHIQYLEDRLHNITTTNTNEDEDLDAIEKEAYVRGNMTFRNWTDSITGNKLNEGKKKDPFGLNESSQPTFTMYSGITGDAWEKIWKDKNFKDKVTNITSDEDFALDYSYNFKTGKYEDKYVKISNIPLDAFVSVRDRDYEDDDDFESIANLGDEEKINAIKYNDLFLVNLFPYKSQIKTTLIDDSLNEKKKPYKHKSGFNPKLGKDPFGLNAYARELAMGLEEQENQFKVYLDMDGVIADFDQRFRDLSGMEPRDFENKYGKKAFWNLIDEENKIKFWVGIPTMPGASDLVDAVKNYNYELLTSPSAKKQSYLGKILWVRNHIGSVFPSKPRINFKKAKEKHLVKPQLTKTDILIDDREDTIGRWNAAGGTGIVYKNISQVLNDLGKLGL